MTRLFVEDELIGNAVLRLNRDDSHYLASVLRMRIGDEVSVVGRDRNETVAVINSIDKNSVILTVGEVFPNSTEPANEITLYQCVSKGERMDLTIQKSVELGVTRIVPVWSSRCVVRREAVMGSAAKTDRWQKIALEAARQSGRGIVPRIEETVLLKQALSEAKENCSALLFPWEEEHGQTLKQAIETADLSRTAVFIGPEGGFSQEEAELATEYGASRVTIGRRILRTETAGPAVLAMILFHTEL